MEIGTLQVKVDKYKSIIDNTIRYRKEWEEDTKQLIITTLEKLVAQTGLDAIIKREEKLNNLETIIFTLGKGESGISEKFEEEKISRALLKEKGVLVFQQLFNGKIIVWVGYPVIEGLNQPSQPKNLEIVRPKELKEGFILRYVETFLQEIIQWEDYDDDNPNHSRIGFQQKITLDGEAPEA
jgi:hypothetical protein